MRTKNQKKSKSDLQDRFLKEEIDLNPKLNREIFDKFFNIIIESIKQHKNIELRNFGTFKIKKMPLRIGTNPKNQNKIYIPEKFKLTFKLSKNNLIKINE